MKIIITGGSGLLGQYLNIALSGDNDIISLYNINTGNCTQFKSYRVDINEYENLKNIIDSFKPDAVIHTAGFTRPEACNNDNKDLVYKTNVEATKNISRLCGKYNAKLIYTSTDLVYDGDSGGMMREDGKLNPVTIYAESKLNAEREIRLNSGNYIILRTSLMYGFGLNHSVNNFHKMYDDLRNRRRPKLFTDQYRTPLSLINASELISEIVKSDVKNEIINFAGKERVTRVELGERLCEIAGFDKNLIERIKMSDIPGFPAVKDVSLNTDKLQSLGFKQKSIEEAIYEIIKGK